MPLLDQPDSPELEDIQNSFIGGAVNNREPFLLPPNAAMRLLNVRIDMDGSLKKLGGLVPRGPANQDFGADNPNGLFGYWDENRRKLYSLYGTSLYANDENSEAVSAFGWAQIANGASFIDTDHVFVRGTSTHVLNSTPALDTLFACACVSASRTGPSFSRVYFFGASNETHGLTGIGGTDFRYLAWFQRRLWSINQDQVFWSPINSGHGLGDSISVGEHGIDANVAITPLREPTPRMLIFRKRAVYLLDIYWSTDGFYTSSQNSMDFTQALLRPIIRDTGCVAPRGWTWIPGGQAGDYLFLSREGIRSLNRSLTDVQVGASIPLSWPIQRIIDRINWDWADKATAVYHEQLAYFAFPVDGSTFNNMVVAYDVRYNHWFELDHQVSDWAMLDIPGKQKTLFFQSSLQGNENYTNPVNNIDQHHIYDTSSGVFGQFATVMDMDIETRAYAFDHRAPLGAGINNLKRPNTLDLGIKSGETTASFTLSYRINGSSNWTALADISIPSGSTGLVRKRISLRKLPPSYYIDFRIRDNTTPGFFGAEIQHMKVSAYPMNSTFAR